MARLMKPGNALALAFNAWAGHQRQIAAAKTLDHWYRGTQQQIQDPSDSGLPFMPDGKASTTEYRDIASRVPNQWGGFLVESLAQTCSLEGVYLPGSNTLLEAWKLWQKNRMDARQGPLYRGAFGHGCAYMAALPAVDPWTGDRSARFSGYSALRMSAYYAEPEDEFPMYALLSDREVTPDGEPFHSVRLFDENAVHYMEVRGEGLDLKDWRYLGPENVHQLGFCPVVDYPNEVDLDGRVRGEIEPFIPLLRRIDQDVFDRLIVQRFGAWVVRYGTGLAKPENKEDEKAQALLLKIGDLLVSSDAESKFGTLQPTDLKGFIEAHDSDLRTLSAVSQRPPHHMLGAAANLQAESLAAVEQGLQRRSRDRRTTFGEQHELLFRTGAVIIGNREEARAFDMQVRWRDHESRSLAQTAQALGQLATQLQVPVEILWERIPGWTDSDTERALSKRQLEGVLQVLKEVQDQGRPDPELAA